MNSHQDENRTNEEKGNDKEPSEPVTTERRRENRDKDEKSGEKDGAVLGKINDE